jgi:hypothetical protein
LFGSAVRLDAFEEVSARMIGRQAQGERLHRPEWRIGRRFFRPRREDPIQQRPVFWRSDLVVVYPLVEMHDDELEV